jgi:hypothetical protein
MTVVYNLRYISEDTNPWDSNESMGIFASLDAAKAGFTASMFGDDYPDSSHMWAPLHGGFPRTGLPSAPAWSLVEPDDVDDDGTVCGDYGFHILQEEVLGITDAEDFAEDDEPLEQIKERFARGGEVRPTDAPAPASGGQARMRIISEVLKERARQDRKWGQQDLPDGTGPDETGPGLIWSYSDMRELAQEACNDARDADDRRMDLVLLEEVFEALAEKQPGPLRIELVQVAAVAVKWIEMIDRRPE